MTNAEYIRWLKLLDEELTFDALVDGKGEMDMHEMIFNLCEKLEQEPKTKWIPVSERLPEKGGDYLVTIAFDIGGEELVREVRKDFFCILSKKWLNLSDDNVIAWMPLPEPYMESEENDNDTNI